MNGKDTLHKAANIYACRLNWTVFPLIGKIPAVSKAAGGHAYLDATTDTATIGAWWRRFPSANIGVGCCSSGFFAVDVDPRHGGDLTLAELEKHNGALPHTVRQTTGGGGQHILFASSNALEVPPKGSLGPGIDVKWRGYIVVSPSVHPDTGRQYAWNPDHHPLRCQIAESPSWMTAALFPVLEPRDAGQRRPPLTDDEGWGPKPRYSRAALEKAMDVVAHAPCGEQDSTLVRESFSIGTLVGAGACPQRLAADSLVYAGLCMANQPGRPPWSDREVRDKVERSLADGALHPRIIDR